MADFSRYLPLSQRPPVDESGVSNDWRVVTAERLEGLVARATGPSAADAVRLAQLADRLTASRLERLARRIGVSDAPETGAASGSAASEPAASPGSAHDDPGSPLPRLAALATARRRGEGPKGIAELVEVVRTEARCHSLGPVPALDPMVAGSVALYALTRAPLSVRAAVSGRTLAPVDAPWRLGHGTELRTDTAAILDFLLDGGPVPREVPDPPLPG